MKKALIAAALAAAFGSAHAQQTVKIGMPLTLSGQFADAASQMLNGARTYMKMHGDTVAGKKIELITKDVGGPAPDVAKRLSQELVVCDRVDILAGYVLTPNAMAGGDVSAEAKKFMVVMNAATSVVITKSPYMIRTSVTLPQVMETFGTWAATKGGIKQAYTMVTDYGPGHDSETAFQSAFKAAGGNIVGAVRFEQTILASSTLQKRVPFKAGELWTQRRLMQLQTGLAEDPFWARVEIVPEIERAESLVVPIKVVLEPNSRREIEFGAGYAVAPDGPGLGIELDWAQVERLSA